VANVWCVCSQLCIYSTFVIILWQTWARQGRLRWGSSHQPVHLERETQLPVANVGASRSQLEKHKGRRTSKSLDSQSASRGLAWTEVQWIPEKRPEAFQAEEIKWERAKAGKYIQVQVGKVSMVCGVWENRGVPTKDRLCWGSGTKPLRGGGMRHLSKPRKWDLNSEISLWHVHFLFSLWKGRQKMSIKY
jgi:hypothetical protein